MSDILARLVSSPSSFLKQWPDAPLVFSGDPSWALSLLSSDAVDTLITSHGLPASHVAMASGDFIPATSYSRGPAIDARRLGERLRAGCTLLLHGLHRVHAPLADLCRSVVLALGHPAQANAYLTPPAANGFAHHWDGHSGFLIQTEGVKRWRLYSPVVPDPLTPGSIASGELPSDFGSRAPIMEVDLRAGDVLWIPRGWIHNGSTLSDWSLHVTIGIRQFTAHGMLGPLLAAASSSPALRAPLPPGAGHDAEVLRESLASSREVLIDWLSSLSEEDLAALVSPVIRQGLGDQGLSDPPHHPVRSAIASGAIAFARGGAPARYQDPSGS